jgi:hypothetical protein
MRKHLLISRKKIVEEESDRLRSHEQARLNMQARWEHKTRNNPFHENILLTDQKREDLETRKAAIERLELDKQRLLDSMTGQPIFEICPKEYVRNVSDFDDKVALGYRLVAREKFILEKEKKLSEQLVHRELVQLTQNFPKIAERLISLDPSLSCDSRPLGIGVRAASPLAARSGSWKQKKSPKNKNNQVKLILQSSFDVSKNGKDRGEGEFERLEQVYRNIFLMEDEEKDDLEENIPSTNAAMKSFEADLNNSVFGNTPSPNKQSSFKERGFK